MNSLLLKLEGCRRARHKTGAEEQQGKGKDLIDKSDRHCTILRL